MDLSRRLPEHGLSQPSRQHVARSTPSWRGGESLQRESSSLSPELVAGRYRLVARVGHGGMGEVWEGVDESLGRRVALKFLLRWQPEGAATHRFILEARTSAQLSSPHVVAVYDTGVERGRPYLVTEFLDGRNLAEELVADGPFSPGETAEAGRQVAEGLAVAHARGVIHRDVKPANLLRGADGTIKIADFGIARFADETTAGLTGAGEVLGTCAYLSPERALGRTVDPQSDMYALGCVLYELLVGRPPFQADNAAAVIYQHVDVAPDPPHRHRGAGVPTALDVFIMRLLSKSPDERPTAREAAAFLADPLALAAVESVTASSMLGVPRPPAPEEAVLREAAQEEQPAHGAHRLRPLLLGGAALVGTAILGLSATAYGPGAPAPSAEPPAHTAQAPAPTTTAAPPAALRSAPAGTPRERPTSEGVAVSGSSVAKPHPPVGRGTHAKPSPPSPDRPTSLPSTSPDPSAPPTDTPSLSAPPSSLAPPSSAPGKGEGKGAPPKDDKKDK